MFTFEYEKFLTSAIVTAVILGTIALLYFVLYFIRFLAERDLFFTVVPEGKVKAVVINEKFRRFVMSYRGHRFRRDIANEPNHDLEWLIEKYDELDHGEKHPLWDSVRDRFVGGLHWIGIWPFASIYGFKLKWASIEQKIDGTAGKNPEPVFVFNPKEETIKALLVRADVYGLLLKDVEVKLGLPVSMVFAIRISIENPYKALFKIEKWLEATLDQLGSELRRELGNMEYSELLAFHKDKADLGEMENIKPTIADIRERFGVVIERTQLLELVPDPQFVKLTLLKYEAQQTAEATIERARGETKRVEMEFKAITDAPNGLFLKSLEALKGATVVLGGDNMGGVVKTLQVGSTATAPTAPTPPAT